MLRFNTEAQLKSHSKNSQIRLTHLLSDFVYLIEVEQPLGGPIDFATQLKSFIVSILHTLKSMLESNKADTQNSEKIICL